MSGEVLSLGVDSSGIQRGADQAVRSLAEIKKAAQEAANAIASLNKSTSSSSASGAAAQAKSTAGAMAEAEKATRKAKEEMSGWRSALEAGEGAQEQFNMLIERARELIVGLGVAFAGLKLADFIGEATMAAARYETLGIVLNQVGQHTNHSAAEIDRYVKSVADMGITLKEARLNVIRMIETQIDLSNATQLARAAQDAAVIAGVNSSQAFEMLIHVITSGNSEMLRTLGLHTSFEAAYTREAAAAGKSVAALTEQEKTHARLQAVMLATVNAQGAYEAAMDTAGKQITSMARYAEDAQTKIGAIFNPSFTLLVKDAGNALKELNTYLDSPAGQQWADRLGSRLRALTENIKSIGEIAMAAIGGRLVLAMMNAVVSGRALAAVMGMVGGPIGLIVTGLSAATVAYLTWQTAADRAVKNVNDAAAQLSATHKDATDATHQLSDAEAELEKQRQQFEANEAARALRRKQRLNDESMDALKRSVPDLAKQYAQGLMVGPESGTVVDINSGTTYDMQIGTPAQQAAFNALKEQARLFNEGKITLDAWLADINQANNIIGNADGFAQLRDRILDQSAALEKAGQNARQYSRDLEELAKKQQEAGRGPIPNTQNDLIALQHAVKGHGITLDASTGQILQDAQEKADSIQTSYDNAVQSAIKAVNYWDTASKDATATAEQRKEAAEQELAAERLLLTLLGEEAKITSIIASTRRSAAEIDHDKIVRETENLRKYGPVKGARQNALDDYREKLANDPSFGVGLSEAERKARIDQYTADKARLYDLQQANKGAAAGASSVAAAQTQAEWAERVAEAAGRGAYYQRQAREEMERAVGAAQGSYHAAEAAAKARAEEAKAIGDANAKLMEQQRVTQETTTRSMALVTGGLGGFREAKANEERDRILRDVGPTQNAMADKAAQSFSDKEASTRAEQAAQQVEKDREDLALAQAEYSLRDQIKEKRELALELVKIDLAQQRDLVGATGEQADAIRAAYEEQRRLTAAMLPYKQAIIEADQAHEQAKQMASSLVQSIDSAVFSAKSLGEAFQGVLQTLEKMVAQALIFTPLQKSLDNWLGGSGIFSLFSKGASAAGAAGAAGATTAAAQSASLISAGVYAKGGAFERPLRDLDGISTFSNSIVSSPTLFKFATGGGLMGEAGPEAILPLTRTSDGRLGVAASGGGGGGDTITVNAPITVQGGAVGQNGQLDPKALASLQQQLSRAVDVAVRQRIAQEKRPGGDLY